MANENVHRAGGNYHLAANNDTSIEVIEDDNHRNSLAEKLKILPNNNGKWKQIQIVSGVVIIFLLQILIILAAFNLHYLYSGSLVSELKMENARLHSDVNRLLDSVNFTLDVELERRKCVFEKKFVENNFENCTLERKELLKFLQRNIELEKENLLKRYAKPVADAVDRLEKVCAPPTKSESKSFGVRQNNSVGLTVTWQTLVILLVCNCILSHFV